MEECINLLKKYKQEHLLNFFELCNQKQKENLISQIKNTDFKLLEQLYNISKTKTSKKIDVSCIGNLRYTNKNSMDEAFKEKIEKIGIDVIKNNNYAVVTMAGGQGTRLEHKGPKGTYLLQVKPKAKYLFEILADSLKEANEKYNIILNWYIMTSEENNFETVSFFEKNKYFGYPKEYIKFFTQGNMPLLSEDGKVLIDENYNIKRAADGNGCIYKSMKKSGILEDMKNKNIKWIFIGAVDNVLLNMIDPVLLGLTIFEKNEIASKSIVKLGPYEKVGVFCKKNSKPTVIEYSEMPEYLAEMLDENGELVYGESHIMCNLFSINALEKIAQNNLPYHSAHKKANYLDNTGKLIIAEKPNVYKYESFIFDAFEFFDDITILRGKREEDFAPVKNKTGVDSAETAIDMYNKRYKYND